MKSLFIKLWNNQNVFLLNLLAALVIVSYLFFSQQQLPTGVPNSDKIGHIFVFFTLALLIFKATTLRRSYQMLLLLGYGVLVEVIQHFIPYRSGGLDDVIADVAGFVLFYLITLNTTLRLKLKQI